MINLPVVRSTSKHRNDSILQRQYSLGGHKINTDRVVLDPVSMASTLEHPLGLRVETSHIKQPPATVRGKHMKGSIMFKSQHSNFDYDSTTMNANKTGETDQDDYEKENDYGTVT